MSGQLHNNRMELTKPAQASGLRSSSACCADQTDLRGTAHCRRGPARHAALRVVQRVRWSRMASPKRCMALAKGVHAGGVARAKPSGAPRLHPSSRGTSKSSARLVPAVTSLAGGAARRIANGQAPRQPAGYGSQGAGARHLSPCCMASASWNERTAAQQPDGADGRRAACQLTEARQASAKTAPAAHPCVLRTQRHG